jgi:sugar phosphate isomerase/epimerase
MKLGVFTVSVPEWDPIECIEKLGALGYDGIEWRVCEDKGDRSKPSFWSGNRTSMTAEELMVRSRELKAKAKAHKLAMPSLGSYINCDRLDWVETHMQACKAIGAKSLRIGPGGYKSENGPYPEQIRRLRAQYRKVAKLARQYKVRAVIETHMGQFCPTVHKAMGVLDGLDPKDVGIMWDPGNQVTEGSERYDMAIEIAGPYLAEVHVKNAAWFPGEEKDGRTTWAARSCPVHKGIVDWPAVIASLKAHRYNGWLFFEDFSTEKPQEARVARNLRWFRSLLGT